MAHMMFVRRFMSSTAVSASVSCKSSPVSMISSHGSAVYHKLKVGPMKRLYKYYTPTAINLAGGVPMESIFPIDGIDVHLKNNDEFSLKKGQSLHMNYLRGDGIGELKDWIGKHVEQLHKPNFHVSICQTVGSTDALSKIFTMLNGDCVMFDQFAYGTAVSATKTLGRASVGVEMDEFGMVPESLKKQTLLARAHGLNPDCIYLVPTAQNPTGVTMSSTRKQQIYDICRELDLIIIEDDAYYYIHYGDNQGETGPYDPSCLPGITHLPRSFLSMDTDGRVLRLDSLSKFIAPGMRLGWIAGPTDFTDKYLLLQEMTTQFPSGLSQSTFLGLVKHWGNEGLDTHVRSMQAHYKQQRDVMVAALTTSLGKMSPAHVSFNSPTGGMFLWLKLLSGPSSEELFKQLAAAGVITVPGGDFQVPPLNALGCGPMVKEVIDPPIVRLTFAASSPDQIRSGVARLAAGLSAATGIMP